MPLTKKRHRHYLGYKSKTPIPAAILRYRELALIPGAFPHPSLILREIPKEVATAYNQAMPWRGSGDMGGEMLRRAYMTLLADAVMLQNPLDKSNTNRVLASRAR